MAVATWQYPYTLLCACQKWPGKTALPQQPYSPILHHPMSSPFPSWKKDYVGTDFSQPRRSSVMQGTLCGTILQISFSSRISGSHSGVMNVAIFWNIAQCSLYANWHYGGMHQLHLQGRKSAKQETRVQQVALYIRNANCSQPIWRSTKE
jgi:hypothetical protein